MDYFSGEEYIQHWEKSGHYDDAILFLPIFVYPNENF